MVKKQKVSLTGIVKIAGAFVAFLIGSGFATGQEVLQYFTAYGYSGIFAIAAMLLLFVYVSASLCMAGYEMQFEKSSDVFAFYCGKYVGALYDYFTIAFLFMSFIVMIAGTGATVNQHYGLSPAFGGVTMAVLAICTVVLGLGKIVDIIGKIGPAIVVLAICLGLAAIIQNPAGISEGAELISSGKVTTMKAGTSWFTSAASYVGFCMLWLTGFLAAIGKTAGCREESVYGSTLGAFAFAGGCLTLMLGLLGNISLVANTQIPLLILANKFSPLLATAFTVIIFFGIYTTAIPLLWQVVARFAVEGTKKYRVLTVALAALGCFCGLMLPFNRILNIIYGINGYVGILLLVFMVIRDIKTFREGYPKPAAKAQSAKDAALI